MLLRRLSAGSLFWWGTFVKRTGFINCNLCNSCVGGALHIVSLLLCLKNKTHAAAKFHYASAKVASIREDFLFLLLICIQRLQLHLRKRFFQLGQRWRQKVSSFKMPGNLANKFTILLSANCEQKANKKAWKSVVDLGSVFMTIWNNQILNIWSIVGQA